ncbi:carboxy-terminal kinesin 2 [Ixodes scapularis]
MVEWVLHLNKLMQVVFTKLGVPDFGISDISVPLPKRSRKLLSILCNFWVRLGRQWNMWSDIEVGLAAAKTDREAKRAELDAVKAKVNQLSQHPGINPERLAAAQGELAAENKALATKEPKQAVVMNDYKNLKSAKCQVTEQLKKSEVEVLDLRSAVHDVRARICHSPERQRRCLAEEAETGSQLQEEHRHLQTRVEELRRKMQKAPREREALTKLKTQLLFSLAVEQQLESLVQAKDNASARRKSAEDKYHRLLKEREAVAEKKSQLNGRTALKHQAMQSQLSFKKEQLAQAKQRLEELHLERQEVVCSKDSELEVLIKDNTELQVQLEHVKRLTLKNDSLKEELRHKTNEVAKVTAELESTMTKLGCCQREKQSLQQTVSQLTGNYAGLRAEHSAMQLLLQTEQEKCSRLAESLRQSQEREAEKDQQLQDAEMMRRDLHNTLQELKGNIRVFCRVRPMLPSEEREGERLSRIWFPDEETVELVKPDTEKVMAFPFDRVFPGSAAQAEVYEETGSGKTFTMEGPPDLDLGCPNDSQLGLIPRALQQVFMSAQKLQNTHHWEFTMVASYLEIYNDNVQDLLSTRPRCKQTVCQIKQEKDGSMMVTNATKTTVTSSEQIYELLRRARKHRAVRATQCNEHSSRSHSVFQLRITGTSRRTGVGSRGLLNLVDLCGSERLDESKAEGARLREAQQINRSLSNLGNVILALSQKAEHVPYRNSKSTFLLMDSLGGNSKTHMLLNVSPREKNLAETINSLRFATTVNQCDIGTAHRKMQASSHY